MGNLGPLTRSSHRLKTHGRWRLKQPEPGVYLWRSPHGWLYLVDHTGTHSLGKSATASALWDAAMRNSPRARPRAGIEVADEPAGVGVMVDITVDVTPTEDILEYARAHCA